CASEVAVTSSRRQPIRAGCVRDVVKGTGSGLGTFEDLSGTIESGHWGKTPTRIESGHHSREGVGRESTCHWLRSVTCLDSRLRGSDGSVPTGPDLRSLRNHLFKQLPLRLERRNPVVRVGAGFEQNPAVVLRFNQQV